jgi:UTP--glucose-1-phosphate uridylyltransferase
MTMKKVTKAVFPVAGLGSRFLPATKASPKEMMPIVDKPLIQYAVEEAVAGVTDLVFITGRSKRAIEDHFDKAYELETELENRGKAELLKIVRDTVPSHVNCIYIRQAEALGLGHAVLCAAPVVGEEPFAVLLADDLLDGEGAAPVMKQMVDVYNYNRCSVLGVMNVPAQTRQYGIVSTERDGRHPARHRHRREAEARGGAVHPGGGGALHPDRADLRPPAPAHAGRRRRAAAHRRDRLAAQGGGGAGLPVQGVRYDCGSKLGYLQATVELG